MPVHTQRRDWKEEREERKEREKKVCICETALFSEGAQLRGRGDKGEIRGCTLMKLHLFSRNCVLMCTVEGERRERREKRLCTNETPSFLLYFLKLHS